MTLFQWSQARAHKDLEASLQTYQVGAHFKALNEPVFSAPSDSRYTQVGFNIFSVQVWACVKRHADFKKHTFKRCRQFRPSTSSLDRGQGHPDPCTYIFARSILCLQPRFNNLSESADCSDDMQPKQKMGNTWQQGDKWREFVSLSVSICIAHNYTQYFE